jgi:hypothetical protein
MMNDPRRFSMVKPTVETPFSIDFDWWKQHDSNWRVFLFSFLCPEHQSSFADSQEDISVDWVDPETAEVRLVDGLQHILMSHCARQPDFLSNTNALVDSVFRTLLAHGNEPMTPVQLGQVINRPPDTILRTLGGMQVYKGMRPHH